MVVDIAMMAKMADSRRFGDWRNNAAKRLIFASSDCMTTVDDDNHATASEVCNAVVNRNVTPGCICQSNGGVEETNVVSA